MGLEGVVKSLFKPVGEAWSQLKEGVVHAYEQTVVKGYELAVKGLEKVEEGIKTAVDYLKEVGPSLLCGIPAAMDPLSAISKFKGTPGGMYLNTFNDKYQTSKEAATVIGAGATGVGLLGLASAFPLMGAGYAIGALVQGALGYMTNRAYEKAVREAEDTRKREEEQKKQMQQQQMMQRMLAGAR